MKVVKIRAKKSLGQHFLTSASALSAMTDAADVNPGDIVLEIGPGQGVLTRQLANMAGKVIAVEKDASLISELKEKFGLEILEGKLDIVEGDILDFDPNILTFYKHPFKIVANIPYYITGEIIRKFLTASYKPESMTLLVQKEVAERIVAKPARPNGHSGGEGKESILSLSVKFFGKPSYIQTVKKGSFNPPPKVDSAIIYISDIRQRTGIDEKIFFETIKTGFKSKRKKLISNLSVLYQKDALASAFEGLSLSINTRAEDVDIEMWIKLISLLNGKVQ